MATAPQYAATPVIGAGFVSVANANRDGTGSVIDVLTGGPNGTRIDKIKVQAIASTAGGMIRLYVQPPSLAGRLIMEIPVDPIAASQTVPAFHADIDLAGGLTLPQNWSLMASTSQSVAFWVTAFGGNF